MENSDYIWSNYANNHKRGKVCVVFGFGKLRNTISNTLRPGNAALEYDGNRVHQIFSVNYGIVKYIEWHSLQTNSDRLANPIQCVLVLQKDNQGNPIHVVWGVPKGVSSPGVLVTAYDQIQIGGQKII